MDNPKYDNQKIYEVQAILQALKVDARAREEGEAVGMPPVAAETLAELGWQILEDLPDILTNESAEA